MADVQPFRAVRYTGAAGPLAELVAPPYDVVGEDERAELYTRSPYNVRPPDASRVGGRRRPAVPGVARSRVLEQDDDAVDVAQRRAVRRPGRRLARASRSARLDPRRAVRVGDGPAARADARTHPGRATRPAPRDPRAARADLRARRTDRGPSPRRRERPTSRSMGRAFGGSTRAGLISPASCSSPTGTTATRARSSSVARLGEPVADHGPRRLRRRPGPARRSRPTACSRAAPISRSCTSGEAVAELTEALNALAAEPRERSAAVAYRPGRRRARARRGRRVGRASSSTGYGLDGIALHPAGRRGGGGRRPR